MHGFDLAGDELLMSKVPTEVLVLLPREMPSGETRDVIHLACRKRVHFELHPRLQHFACNHVSDCTLSQQSYALYLATYNECADLDGRE